MFSRSSRQLSAIHGTHWRPELTRRYAQRCFSTFRSVFTRRNVGPGVSLGVPWRSLVGPWGVVLDSLWGTDAPDTTHTDVLALSVFLCVSVFVFSIVSGRLLGRPIGRPRAPYAMHTDVSSVFTGAIRLHAAWKSSELSATQRKPAAPWIRSEVKYYQ